MSALTDWDPALLQWEVSPVISIGEEGEHSKCERLNPGVWVCLLPDFPSFSMLPASPSSKEKVERTMFLKSRPHFLKLQRWKLQPTWFVPICQSRNFIPSMSLVGRVPSPSATFIPITSIFERKEGEIFFCLPTSFQGKLVAVHMFQKSQKSLSHPPDYPVTQYVAVVLPHSSVLSTCILQTCCGHP